MANYDEMNPLGGLTNPWPTGSPEWLAWQKKQQNIAKMVMPVQGETSPIGKETADKLRLRNEMAGNLGVAGIAAGAQLIANAIPTAQDKLNKSRLDTLNAALNKGEIDEGTAQAQAIEAESNRMQMQAAGRATEGRQRAEQMQAAMGGTTSAAAALTPAREAQRAYSTDALAAGQTRLAARLEEAARQYQERDQRTAYKSERQAQKRSNFTQTVAGLAQVGGKVAAARSTPEIELPADFASMDPQVQKVIIEQAYANQRASMMGRDVNQSTYSFLDALGGGRGQQAGR